MNIQCRETSNKVSVCCILQREIQSNNICMKCIASSPLSKTIQEKLVKKIPLAGFYCDTIGFESYAFIVTGFSTESALIKTLMI